MELWYHGNSALNIKTLAFRLHCRFELSIRPQKGTNSLSQHFPTRDSDRCGQVFSVTCWVMIVLNKPFFSPAFHLNITNYPLRHRRQQSSGKEWCVAICFARKWNIYRQRTPTRNRERTGKGSSLDPVAVRLLWGRDGPCSCWDPPPFLSLDFKASANCKGKVLMSQEEK